MVPDSEMIERIRGGDGDAFERLFRTYGNPLVRFLYKCVSDIPVVEFLVQDLFIETWADRSRLNPSANIKTYLYTSAKNRALNHFRNLEEERRNAKVRILELPQSKTPEDERQRGEVAVAIQREIQALPEKTRICFTMNRFDQLTCTEIADIQGISVKTVETLMGRTLKTLRQRLAHLL